MPEDREGLLSWWYHSCLQLFTEPNNFLQQRGKRDSFKEGTIFFSFNVALSTLVSATAVLGIIMTGRTDAFLSTIAHTEQSISETTLITASLLTGIFLYIIGFISNIIVAGIYKLFYWPFKTSGTYSQTYSMLIFAYTPIVLLGIASMVFYLIYIPAGNIIAPIARIVGAGYALYLTIKGMASKHDITYLKAATPIIGFFSLSIIMLAIV